MTSDPNTNAKRKDRRGRRADPTLDGNPHVSLYLRQQTKQELAKIKSAHAKRTGRPISYDELFQYFIAKFSELTI